MKRGSLVLWLPAFLLSVSAQEQKPVFKALPTQVVALFVTVTDASKRLVPDLTQADFEVVDDGRPQPITVFENRPAPVSVVVMVDTSASMTGNIVFLQQAAEQFLLRLLPQDRGRVGAFNDKIEMSASFTSDRDRLVAELRGLDFGNPTRLHDAIDASMDALEREQNRRVVLVFTDGEDTASRLDDDEVLDRARREEMMIYAIGLQSDYFNGVRQVRSRPDRSLKRLAEETGGGYFELEKTDELAPTFTRVAQELHSQYVIGFVPPVLDGKVHKIAVNVRRAGMKARTRKSYVAPSAATETSK